MGLMSHCLKSKNFNWYYEKINYDIFGKLGPVHVQCCRFIRCISQVTPKNCIHFLKGNSISLAKSIPKMFNSIL